MSNRFPILSIEIEEFLFLVCVKKEIRRVSTQNINKFFAIFSITFSFYSKYLYSIKFYTISELFFCFFEINVSGFIFPYITTSTNLFLLSVLFCFPGNFFEIFFTFPQIKLQTNHFVCNFSNKVTDKLSNKVTDKPQSL